MAHSNGRELHLCGEWQFRIFVLTRRGGKLPKRDSFMRVAMWCFAVLLSLPLFAQQKATPSAAKPSAPELTAEGYRDLVLNVADAMSSIGGYGTVAPGIGKCRMTVTYSELAVANRRKAWASARVPAALKASHAEILKWIESGEANLKSWPTCMEAMLQASAEQFNLLFFLGKYDDLRKNAAKALSGMDVTLTPIEKKAPEKK